MPGYAYPVGATTADTGVAKSVTALIDADHDLVTVFTATQKTRINSILVSNNLGTIVPVDLYVYRDEDEEDYFMLKTRVLKSRYMVLPLVSGDTRVSSTSVQASVNDRMIATEILLQAGDAIKASCPIEDAINITLDLKEGVK